MLDILLLFPAKVLAGLVAEFLRIIFLLGGAAIGITVGAAVHRIIPIRYVNMVFAIVAGLWIFLVIVESERWLPEKLNQSREAEEDE